MTDVLSSRDGISDTVKVTPQESVQRLLSDAECGVVVFPVVFPGEQA
jgi:hypothetical protein